MKRSVSQISIFGDCTSFKTYILIRKIRREMLKHWNVQKWEGVCRVGGHCSCAHYVQIQV